MEQALKRLQEEIRACRACVERGYPVTPPPVVGLGTRARILLVGQAPGGMENESRLPFSGPAGKRLFAWLERAGFDPERIREEIYFAALTRCYPGKDARGSGDRRPSREERALCTPFLGREFALIDPKLILLVGQMAIEHFLGKMPSAIRRRGFEMRAASPSLPHPQAPAPGSALQSRGRLEHAIRLIHWHRAHLIPSKR